jgi:Spy/CpxP family protein refolding chaperone
MKTFLTFALVALLAPGAVLAGDHGHHKHRGHHTDRMIEKLELDESQAAKVRDIMKEQREKFRAAFREGGEDKAAGKERFEALHKETRERLAGVLNAGQLAKFDEMHAKHREKMKEFGEKHARRKAEFREKLQLTDEQASKVEAIFREQHEKKRALFREKKAGREERRAQFDALHEETRAKLAEVLSAEQLAKLDEHWKSHRDGRHGRKHGGKHRGEGKSETK